MTVSGGESEPRIRVTVGGRVRAGPGPAVDLAGWRPGGENVATESPSGRNEGDPGSGGTGDHSANGPDGDGDSGTGSDGDSGAQDGRGSDGPVVDPETVAAAVRADEPVDGVRVECPSPGAVHEHVGLVGRESSVDLRGALAAAARSRGHVAPNRETLQRARETLREFEAADGVDEAIDEAKRRVADADERERALRERVSTRRGRLVALRERMAGDDDDATAADATGRRGSTSDSGTAADGDSRDTDGHDRHDPLAEAEAAYRAAVRELSEVETERIAAEQRLARLREIARETRDDRGRRLELEDRVANLERRVRLSLARAVYDEFATAVEQVPGTGDAGDEPGDYEGDPATAALAVVRVASLSAPVVLAGRRFPDAVTARTRLDAPVIRL